MTVDALRQRYKAGTKIRLLSMDDIQSPGKGSLGIVQGVDDAGQLLMRWGNGSCLSLIPGVDDYEIITEEEYEAELQRLRDEDKYYSQLMK